MKNVSFILQRNHKRTFWPTQYFKKVFIAFYLIETPFLSWADIYIYFAMDIEKFSALKL